MNPVPYAIRYSVLGWKLAPPIPPGEKRPIGIEWNPDDYSPPENDADIVEMLGGIEANVAILTGKRSGITVVDVDGPTGEASLAALGLDLSTVPQVATSRGRHLYFAYAQEIVQDAGILPGMDVRNDGGLIVAPPSVHASGHVYRWTVSPLGPLPPMPTPLWEALLSAKKAKTKDAPAANTEGRIHEVGVGLVGVAEGSRNDTLASLCGEWYAKGLSRSEVEILALAFADRCSPPFPHDEAMKVVASIERYHPETIQTPPSAWKPPRTVEELIEAGQKPVEWIIEGLIPAGGVAAIFGPPKSVKSTAALAMLMSVSNGKPLCKEWRVGPPVPCGYVTWEDGLGRLGRRILVNRRQTGPLVPNIWDKGIAPQIKLPFHEEQLIGMIRRYGWRALVADVMIYLSTSESENDNAGMQPLCASAQRIASETGVAFIMIHHSRKAQENGRADIRESARGASVISGMADSLIHVVSLSTGGFSLKALPKDAAESVWRVDYDNASAVPWTIKPSAGEDARTAEILEVITKLGGATRATVADELDISKNTASKSLAALIQSGEVTSETIDNKGTIMYRINKRVT